MSNRNLPEKLRKYADDWERVANSFEEDGDDPHRHLREEIEDLRKAASYIEALEKAVPPAWKLRDIKLKMDLLDRHEGNDPAEDEIQRDLLEWAKASATLFPNYPSE